MNLNFEVGAGLQIEATASGDPSDDLVILLQINIKFLYSC